MQEQWKNKAREIVLDTADLALSNDEKIDHAIDKFIPWADEIMDFKNPILESISDWLLRKPFRPLVKGFLELAHESVKNATQ